MVTTEELACHYDQCKSDIAFIRSDLTTAMGTIQTDVQKLKQDMEKQNAIILGVQHEVTEALQDFAVKLYDLTFGKTSMSTHTLNPALGAATSKPQHQGGHRT